MKKTKKNYQKINLKKKGKEKQISQKRLKNWILRLLKLKPKINLKKK